MDDQRFLTPEEVSNMLRIPIGTLAYWRHINEGPPSLKFGKRVRYVRDQVEEWARTQQKAAV